ncbi:MATE family efflux transporter [Clostridium hydrogeniformans]|uniref:MATE family efflux transporter n=1 Tax=Clostridium hydrogeniformans TaxID=349933 RepID=UPI000482BF34|nr:MATE family efflux transporter [Clostridium hydrogeniformans]
MSSYGKIFTEGKVSRVLLKFAIPAIISLLVTELYNMVDTFFVGRYVGANAIGALTIAFPVQRLLSSIGLLIAVGASATIARYLGEKNIDELKNTITSALTLTLVSLIVIPLVIYIFLDGTLVKMGASETIFPLAKEYISIILIGGVFQSLTYIMCYSMNALGNTKITLYATSLGAILNVIIDAILVMGLGWGVKGAAIATVFSQFVSFIFTVYVFRKVTKELNLRVSLGFYGDLVKTIIAVGFSTFIIEISDAVVAVLLNNLLGSHGGDRAIIIIGAITRVSMFLYIAIIGMTSAMQPIVAYNYGAKNYKRVEETIKKTMKAVIITSTALWMILMIFTKPILGSFLKDPVILKDAVWAFRVVISAFPVIGVYYVSIYVYQSIGEAKMSFLLSIYRQLVLFIPLVILAVNIWGVVGAWMLYPIVDIIAAVTGIIYIKKVREELNEEYEIFKLKNLHNMIKA